MKRFLLSTVFVCTLVFAGAAFAQEGPRAVLVDDHGGQLSCCDDRGRLDMFLSELANAPSARGLVVISTKPERRVSAAYRERMILSHAAFRRFPVERFDIVRAVSDDDFRVKYWVIPEGAERPEVESVQATYAFPEATSPLMLTAEYEDIGLCPEVSGSEIFAKFLKDNPGARGNIVVRERTLGRASAKGRRLLREFVAEGIARPRLRVFTRTRGADDHEAPVVEYWFLP